MMLSYNVGNLMMLSYDVGNLMMLSYDVRNLILSYDVPTCFLVLSVLCQVSCPAVRARGES